MKKATHLSSSAPASTFAATGLHPRILEVLERESFKTPSDIQSKSIPFMLKGKDMIAIAPTASGKTLAFTLPLLHELLKFPPARNQTRSIFAVVLTPTRELAQQVHHQWQTWASAFQLQTLCLHGGKTVAEQLPRLRQGADLIVATPGRFLQLLQQRPADFRFVNHLIYDEADKMLDMGLTAELKRIAQLLPRAAQKSMFSATWPKQLNTLALRCLKSPQFVKVEPASQTDLSSQTSQRASTVKEYQVAVQSGMKADFLKLWLKQESFDSVIIFVEQKTTANLLYEFLTAQGLPCARIHSDRNPNQRERAMEEFRSMKNRILIATDLVARGIHVGSVSHVLHYDLALNPEDHVHRVGRAGREEGAEGISLALISPKDRKPVQALERFLKRKLDLLELPQIQLPKKPNPAWVQLVPKPQKIEKPVKEDVVFIRRGEANLQPHSQK